MDASIHISAGATEGGGGGGGGGGGAGPALAGPILILSLKIYIYKGGCCLYTMYNHIRVAQCIYLNFNCVFFHVNL